MGQAKRRGTFAERRDSAIHDQEVVKTILNQQEKKWWDSLTAEEQISILQKRISSLTTLRNENA